MPRGSKEVKAHVHILGGIGHNDVFGDAGCGGVVRLDGQVWFLPMHVD